MTTSQTFTDRTPIRALRVAAAAALLLGAVFAAALGYVEYQRAHDITDHGGGWVSLSSETANVEYTYHDVALAPDYHRSYTVTVRRGNAHLVVFTYDEILHELDVAIDDAMWDEVRLATMGLSAAASVVNQDCAGGSAEELSALDGSGGEVINVFIDNCNSSGGADVRAPVAPVLALFDLSPLLATD